MTKMIVAGLLGFFTLPMVFVIVAVLVEVGKVIGGFGMEPQHYWAGFFIPVAGFALFACTIPFWAS